MHDGGDLRPEHKNLDHLRIFKNQSGGGLRLY